MGFAGYTQQELKNWQLLVAERGVILAFVSLRNHVHLLDNQLFFCGLDFVDFNVVFIHSLIFYRG